MAEAAAAAQRALLADAKDAEKEPEEEKDIPLSKRTKKELAELEMPYMFKRDAETGIWGNEMAYDSALKTYLEAGFFEDRRTVSEEWFKANGKQTDLQKTLRRDYEFDHGTRANTAEIGTLNAERRRKETGTPMGPAYEREKERRRDKTDDAKNAKLDRARERAAAATATSDELKALKDAGEALPVKKVPPKIYRYEWNANREPFPMAVQKATTEVTGPAEQRAAKRLIQKKGLALKKGEYAGSGESSLLHAWKKQRHLEDVRREAMKSNFLEPSDRASRAERHKGKHDDQSLPSVARSERSERRRRKSKSSVSEADDESSVAVSVAVSEITPIPVKSIREEEDDSDLSDAELEARTNSAPVPDPVPAPVQEQADADASVVSSLDLDSFATSADVSEKSRPSTTSKLGSFRVRIPSLPSRPKTAKPLPELGDSASISTTSTSTTFKRPKLRAPRLEDIDLVGNKMYEVFNVAALAASDTKQVINRKISPPMLTVEDLVWAAGEVGARPRQKERAPGLRPRCPWCRRGFSRESNGCSNRKPKARVRPRRESMTGTPQESPRCTRPFTAL